MDVDSTMLPLPFRMPEGRALKGPVPPSFETFYRAQLRYRTGARISSTALRCRYLAWAEQNEGQALSFVALRRAMENVGHRHLLSNGAFYDNAAFVEDAADLPDNFPAPPPIEPGEAVALVHRIDRLAAELGAVRAVAAQLSGQPVAANEGRLSNG